MSHELEPNNPRTTELTAAPVHHPWTPPSSFAHHCSAYNATLRLLEPDPRARRSRDYVVASMASAIASDLITNPLWVVRTRMITSVFRNEPKAGLIRLFAQIFREEGCPPFISAILFFLTDNHIDVFPMFSLMSAPALQTCPTQACEGCTEA